MTAVKEGSSGRQASSTSRRPVGGLVGREELLGQAWSLICRSGRGVLFVGEAGVGKTCLAAAVAEDLSLGDRTIRRAVGSEALADVPLGALIPLLDDGWSGERTQAALLARVTGRLGVPSGDFTLLVDDVHLLDDLSAAALHQLAAQGTQLLLTARAGSLLPDPIAALWQDGFVERIDVGPLSQGDAIQLVSVLLGGQPDSATAHGVWTMARGNPLYTVELVEAARQVGGIRIQDGLWCLDLDVVPSDRLRDIVGRRLERLGRQVRRALEVVALAPDVPEEVLVRLVDPEVLDACEAARLLRVGGQVACTVSLVHPVHGEVVLADLPTRRARVLRGELADALEEVVGATEVNDLRVALLRLAAGIEQPSEILERAGEVALARHDNLSAARLAEAAIAAGGGVESAQLLGSACHRLGRVEEAEEVYAAIDLDSIEDYGLLMATAIGRADNLFWGVGRSGQAREVLARVADLLPAGVDADLIRAAGAAYELMAGRPADVFAAVDQLSEREGPHLPTCLTVRAPALVIAGRPIEAMAEAVRGLNAAIDNPSWPSNQILLLVAQIFAATQAGALAAARTAAERAQSLALLEDNASSLAWVALMRARLELLAGDLDASARWWREGAAQYSVAGQPPGRRWCLTGSMWVASLRLDLVEADALDEEARSIAPRGLTMMESEVLRARAALRAGHGDLAGARALLDEAAVLAAVLGASGLEVGAHHDRVRMGAGGDAVDRLSGVAPLVEGALAPIQAKHGLALAAGDSDGLLTAAGGFEEIGALILAAEAYAQGAGALRALGNGRGATRAARRAQELATACGASTPALTIADEVVPLTAREREIAALVAGGLTSPEVAERLVVSVRTIENHLHRIYAKLGAENRVQLTTWWRSRTTPSAGGEVLVERNMDDGHVGDCRDRARSAHSFEPDLDE